MQHFEYNLKKRNRYDFFIIWGNGLQYTDEILNIIRKEENIQIIRIEHLYIKKMHRFVRELYGCDTVPIHHLRAKIKYLFHVRNEILILFVINHSPEEAFVGRGAFRKEQCQYINRIKWKIREKYNPKRNGIRTEEHIIHASDYEEQVDYTLKLIGYSDGIEFFEKDNERLPFFKPYHIKRPASYTFKKISISNLYVSILKGDPFKGHNSVTTELLPIVQSPHYKEILGGDDYKNYYNRYKYIFLLDDHYPEKIDELRKLGSDQIEKFPPVAVINMGNYFRVLDGAHRLAAALYHKIHMINCVEFRYL